MCPESGIHSWLLVNWTQASLSAPFLLQKHSFSLPLYDPCRVHISSMAARNLQGWDLRLSLTQSVWVLGSVSHLLHIISWACSRCMACQRRRMCGSISCRVYSRTHIISLQPHPYHFIARIKFENLIPTAHVVHKTVWVPTHIAHAVQKESHPARITVFTSGPHAARPKFRFVCQVTPRSTVQDVAVVGTCAVHW